MPPRELTLAIQKKIQENGKYNVRLHIKIFVSSRILLRLHSNQVLRSQVLQLIPQISSLTPVTTAVPLIVVLTLTAAKDAVDDIQRHRSDNSVNNRLSKVLRGSTVVEERWHKASVRLGLTVFVEPI